MSPDSRHSSALPAALLALCLACVAAAQYPPGTEWRRIRTDHFDVVFPKETEADAQRLANTLETFYGPLTKGLSATPKRSTIFLPNQDVTRYTGGYVSLFPMHAVFNAMPSQWSWGTSDWLTMLSVHEGRHIVQLSKMSHGFGKLAKTLMGDSGLGTVWLWTLPEWWVEGDARRSETTMTKGGIGQFASAETGLRALLLSGKRFSYHKAIHGSYKDYVPSSYELGSFLVSRVERDAGPDAWDKIMRRTANRGWNPFAFSSSMKKVTGRSAATTYNDAMSEISELWKTKIQNVEFSQPKIVNEAVPRTVYTNYCQPMYQADGSVLAQKVGIDTYPLEIVRIGADGKERRLFHSSATVVAANRTSVAQGKVVWDEYVPDVRWRRGYSEIVIRDLATGRKRRLTHKTRFMNPVLSPDGTRVAVVEYSLARVTSLVILDAGTGAEVRRMATPENELIQSPAWSADGRRLVMVTHASKGKAITVVDVESGEWKDAIPHRAEDLANPVFYREYALYRSSYDGVNNIFAVRVATGERWSVTSSKFGADSPSVSPDGTKLLYTDYTAMGNNLAELPLDVATWTPLDTVPDVGIQYHGKFHDYAAEVPNTPRPVETYRPSAHLFSFHSWGMTSGPPDLGFGLISNDKMGLASFNASFTYNTNERATGFRTGASYSRFFPVLYTSFSERNRNIRYVDHKSSWTERSNVAGVYVPLNFSRGYYYNGMGFGANVESVGISGSGILPLTYSGWVARIRHYPGRALAPSWGQIVYASYRHAPWANGIYYGKLLTVDGRLFLPGVARYHSLQLEGGYEQRGRASYYYSSQIAFTRGYTSINGSNFHKASVSYAAPLLYPDRALGPFLYVKRVTANAFYDYGQVSTRLYRSTGMEALFDADVLHVRWTLRFGLRYAYRLDFHNARFEPFIGTRW